MLSEPIRVVATIAGVFDSLGIAYLIGGSVAGVEGCGKKGTYGQAL